MTNTHTARGLVWIDVQSPTDEEISSLVSRYSLHPLVGEELKVFDSHTKIVFHPTYVVAVLTIPTRTLVDGRYMTMDREIDFVVGKNFLISTHADSIEQLEYFAKIFETNAILNKDSKIESTAHLFYYIVMRLYGGICDDLKNIRDSIIMAERSIFSGDERKMVQVLSNLSRELIDFREIARTHREVWDEIIENSKHVSLGSDFLPYAHNLHDEFNRFHELIQNSRELINDLRETNDSLLNTKQNDIIRTLTIVTFIFIPATFIASVFTIPAKGVPIIEADGGWTTVIIGIILIAAGIWYAIKRKGWL